jgi:hypothetical protein
LSKILGRIPMSNTTATDMSELDWPAEFERTDPSDREPYSGGFRVTRSEAFQNVLDELATWDGVTDKCFDCKPTRR